MPPRGMRGLLDPMLFKRKQRVACQSCGRQISPDAKICSCGAPGQTLDFHERAQYEVERWRAFKQSPITP